MLPDRRRTGISIGVFLLIYIALNVPPPEFGRAFSGAVCELANAAIGGDRLGNDFAMRLTPAYPQTSSPNANVDEAWTAALHAIRPSTRAYAALGIDLRRTYWVPLATFAALALTSMIWRGPRGLVVLIVGLVILQIPVTFALASHVTGVLYEKYVVELSDLTQSAVRFTHAVLDPPGMVYAMPVVLWTILTFATHRDASRSIA